MMLMKYSSLLKLNAEKDRGRLAFYALYIRTCFFFFKPPQQSLVFVADQHISDNPNAGYDNKIKKFSAKIGL